MQLNLNNKLKITSLMLGFVILLSGCSIKDGLAWLDQRAGELFFQQAVIEDNAESLSSVTSEELTKEMTDKIDTWLEENNLNRYGDPIGTMYAGGTPLFNEATGELRDRYDYILTKIPDILIKIDLSE